MSDITVITPSIPGREHLLMQAIRSVAAQRSPVAAHLIRISRPDEIAPVHLGMQLNALLEAVETRFVTILADDDRLLPDYSAWVERAFDATIDVVYTLDLGTAQPRLDCSGWEPEAIARELETHNFIAAPGTVRTRALRHAGGWRLDWVGGSYLEGGHFDGSAAHADDWALWQALAEGGSRFRMVDRECWIAGTGTHARITTGLF